MAEELFPEDPANRPASYLTTEIHNSKQQARLTILKCQLIVNKDTYMQKEASDCRRRPRVSLGKVASIQAIQGGCFHPVPTSEMLRSA